MQTKGQDKVISSGEREREKKGAIAMSHCLVHQVPKCHCVTWVCLKVSYDSGRNGESGPPLRGCLVVQMGLVMNSVIGLWDSFVVPFVKVAFVISFALIAVKMQRRSETLVEMAIQPASVA